MKKIALAAAALFATLILMYAVTHFYSFIFARHVNGQVVNIERVLQSSTIIQTNTPFANAQVFSFAVAIKEPSGEIVTASSEDRQWAVVQKGQCAEAKYFPYPPWDLNKSGTYHGARLLKLSDCPSK